MMSPISSPFEHITDLYLPIDNPTQLGFSYPDNQPLTREMYAGVLALVEAAKRKRTEDCNLSDGIVAFRSTYMPTAAGGMYIMRKMPSHIMSMADLGMPRVITNHLLSERLLKGGLIIVSGNPGNGKSTSLASIIIERLKKYAGICITVEDPIEMPLQGVHGKGVCLQRGVTGEEAFANAVRGALRAYPAKTNAMMMIGEVRDSETAALALRSSVDGRLVMISMHAGNVIHSILRLCSMASKIMSGEEVRELLSSSFRMCVHQELVSAPGPTGVRLKVDALLDTQSVIGTIRSRNLMLDTLKNDVLQQRNWLRLNMPIELRKID